MKKILLTLALLGFGIAGITLASAQYIDYGYSMMNVPYNYTYGTSYNPSYTNTGYNMGYMNTSYSNYSYPQTNYYGGNSIYGNMMYGNSYSTNYGGNYGMYGNGGIGSYTIGCVSYFYNTRTGATMYTRNICPVYQQPTYTSSYNNSYPMHPSYGGINYGNTQFCTYRYMNGAWYPACGY